MIAFFHGLVSDSCHVAKMVGVFRTQQLDAKAQLAAHSMSDVAGEEATASAGHIHTR